MTNKEQINGTNRFEHYSEEQKEIFLAYTNFYLSQKRKLHVIHQVGKAEVATIAFLGLAFSSVNDAMLEEVEGETDFQTIVLLLKEAVEKEKLLPPLVEDLNRKKNAR